MAEEKKETEKKVAAPAAGTEGAKQEGEAAASANAACTPRRTERQRPAECAGCGKANKKEMWYYRNGGFYCNKRCYQKKLLDLKKKAEAAKDKK
ncbi:MAG TPA: hypothetical protein PKY78_07610 [Candidatus Omnitrophota bacterium]|nr:hypothetical protein [Candidatus Omnitrophota bacterium]HPS20833.1 hypothetical protein [Candidatus Omnitrophota bacterium]